MNYKQKCATLLSVVVLSLAPISNALADDNCLEYESTVGGHENWRIGHPDNGDDDFHPNNKFYAGRDKQGNVIWKSLDNPDVVKFKHCRDAEIVLSHIGGWIYDNVGYEQYD